MTKHKFMLAHKYEGEDPTRYYMSEKLDGIRAIYDGPDNVFISRNGNIFQAPTWFTEHFPRNMILDGELYTKRQDFKNVSGIVRKKKPVDAEWRQITYMVFDLPSIDTTFEERIFMMNHFLKNIPHLKVVDQIKVETPEQMKELHKLWIEQGAEGSMLRLVGSKYEGKRSRNLLKLKEFYNEEAVVDGYTMGTGKHHGILGALRVHWLKSSKESVSFRVGSGFSDSERKRYKDIFPINTIIRIKFWEIDDKTGRPRFPIYEGIRDVRDI